MTKPFVYEVRFLPGTEKGYLLERVTPAGDRQSLSYEPDDSHWMALLSRQSISIKLRAIRVASPSHPAKVGQY